MKRIQARAGSFLHPSQERKHNNKGAALVLVISVVAIVSMLAVVLLSVSLLNYRMKYVNLHSQDNFYDAESVLDEIRTGLTEEISVAVAKAYQETLKTYGSTTETERSSAFKNSFITYVQDLDIIDAEDKNCYNLLDLWNDVSTTQRYNVKLGTNKGLSSLKTDVVSGSSLTWSTVAAKYNSTTYAPTVVYDTANGTVTLKNLVVEYTEKGNKADASDIDNRYMTTITTDIVLSCPPIDYMEQSSAPSDLLYYSFVADDETTALNGGTINVTGSAYLGSGDASVVSGASAEFNNATIAFDGSIGGKLIAGGTLLSENLSQIRISNMTTWAQELCADSSVVTFDGTAKTYLGDDLILSNSAKLAAGPSVTLSGEVKAYGNSANPVITGSAVTLSGSDADNSSAFLINCKDATLDMSGVTSLMIAGNSYVGASAQSDATTTNTDVLMGESVSLKSDQKAYLVPTKYIAPSSDAGGKNPMTEADYLELAAEIDATYPDVANASDNPNYFLYKAGKKELPTALTKAGVTGVSRQVYRVRIAGGNVVSMVYFFLEFDSTESAVKYGAKVAASDSTLSESLDLGHYNTKIIPGLGMETAENSGDNYTFYYNGSVLVPEENNVRFITGHSATGISTALNNRLLGEQKSYQKKFVALRHKLMDYYDELTSTEKERGVYDNLVRPLTDGSDLSYSIQPYQGKQFVNDDAGGTMAVIINGSCTLSGSSTNKVEAYDKDGNLTFSLSTDKLHLLIASGDVSVTGGTSFDGLIIAGGQVNLQGGGIITLKADYDKAADAMAAKDPLGYQAADYMINGSLYLKNGTVTTTGEDLVSYEDYVNFSNWKKE